MQVQHCSPNVLASQLAQVHVSRRAIWRSSRVMFAVALNMFVMILENMQKEMKNACCETCHMETICQFQLNIVKLVLQNQLLCLFKCAHCLFSFHNSHVWASLSKLYVMSTFLIYIWQKYQQSMFCSLCLYAYLSVVTWRTIFSRNINI